VSDRGVRDALAYMGDRIRSLSLVGPMVCGGDPFRVGIESMEPTSRYVYTDAETPAEIT
jgi:hypothetical protein